MSDHVSKLDLERYRDRVDAAWLAGLPPEMIWEDLRAQGCPERTASLFTGHRKQPLAKGQASDQNASRGRLLFILMIFLSIAATYGSGYVVHRFLEHRLINSAFGAGTYESGVHIVDKRQKLSNGRQLPALHGTILTALTVATYFITFGASILVIRGIFPSYFDESDSQK